MREALNRREVDPKITKLDFAIWDTAYFKTIDGKKKITQSIKTFVNRLNTTTTGESSWIHNVKKPVVDAIKQGLIGLMVFGPKQKDVLDPITHYGLTEAKYPDTTKKLLSIAVPYTFHNQNHLIPKEEFELLFDRFIKLLKNPEQYGKTDYLPSYTEFRFTNNMWFLKEDPHSPEPAKITRDDGTVVWETKPEIPPLSEWRVAEE